MDRNTLVVAIFLAAAGASVAQLAAAQVISPSVRTVVVIPSSLPPLKATVDVNCPNGKTYRLSTGGDQGECAVNLDNTGKVTGGVCNGPQGSPRRSCPTDGTASSCIESSGKGSCSINK